MDFSNEDYLDENISNSLSWLPSKTRDFRVHSCYDVILFSLKNKRVQYKKNQINRKYGKGQRGGKDGKDKNGKNSH